MGRVVVVGGGIAGLTAAWRLFKAGHDVDVLEQDPTCGGRMRSERYGDFVLDRGAQFVFRSYEALRAIAAEVGLVDHLRSVRTNRGAILRDGRLHATDSAAPLSLLRSGLLSLRTKARLPRVLWQVWKHRRELIPHDPQLAAMLDDEDMASFIRRTVGDEALEYLFAPSFSATFLGEPEGMSRALVLLTLRFLLGGFGLETFDGGIGRLADALAARVRVHTKCTVISVTSDGDTARVRYQTAGTLEESTVDTVVVAVPGSLVPRICRSLSPCEQQFFRAVRYSRGIVVFLMTAVAPTTLPYYGVAFPRRERLDLYGLALAHQKPGSAPAGMGLLNTPLTPSAVERMWDEPDDRIVELALSELARTPVGRLDPLHAIVCRWDPMLPQFYPGYLRCLDAFLARQDRSPRLTFAGDYLIGPYADAAVMSGMQAAADSASSFSSCAISAK